MLNVYESGLGKMLLTATVLHCLDPVLTIVCCLSYRDPFVLPSEPQEKKAAAARKLELSAGTLSDHMAMLRAFNLWQIAKANGKSIYSTLRCTETFNFLLFLLL